MKRVLSATAFAGIATSALPIGATVVPLAPSTFHMLMALVPGEQHGYGIRKHVEGVTRGNVRLRPGSLYGQLKQMAANGWIAATGRVDGDERERRYYRITDRGRAVAAAEAARLAELVEFAHACRLLPAPS